MKKSLLFSTFAMLAVPVALTSCSDSDQPGKVEENESNGKFVFATTVQGSNATSYVLLTGESLDEGTLSPVNNGLLNDGATQWVFHKNYLYALTYMCRYASARNRFAAADRIILLCMWLCDVTDCGELNALFSLVHLA